MDQKHMNRVNEMVVRFKQEGNIAFQALSDHYKNNCKNWFRHVSKSVRIDLDAFRSIFDETLYNTLNKFEFNRVNNEGKNVHFEFYFTAAIRKRVTTIKRNFYSDKNCIERRAVQFSLAKHDIADEKDQKHWRAFEIRDSLSTLLRSSVDRQMLAMRMQGFTIAEVCRCLDINRREYWTRVGNLRSSVRLAKVV